MNFDVTGPLPTGTTVLEASAGTGKTWAIAALVTRMIAEQEVKITDLLVITFTRAAAGELRSRVRERLVEMAVALAAVEAEEFPVGEVEDLTFLLATGRPRSTPGGTPYPRPRAQLRQIIGRLRAAIADIDAATITTIHGFCHDALDGLGIVGDRDAGFTLVESAEDLLTEVVDDVYLRMFQRAEGEPPFTYDHAGRIARAVTANPAAVIHPLRPAHGELGTAERVDFAHAVREEFQERKRDLGIRTYDDLLSSLAEIVDPAGGTDERAEEARNRLRQRWRGVLVDEFQDTDDTQWRILKSVFHGHRPLTLIGDPKQAIYSFRGGDVTTYLNATRAAQKRTLGFNYRSDGELISNLNGLLEGAELGHEEIRVRPVGTGKGYEDVRLAPAGSRRLRLRVVDAEEFHRANHGVPKIGALREAIAGDVAVDITHLLNAGHEVRTDATGSWRPAEAGDIAVLCHTNDDAQRILRALRSGGIHGVVSGGANVFRSQGAQDWLTLLDAMDQPSNRSIVSAAALTPFFGYRAIELLENADDVLDTVGTRLREYARILAEHGAASVFHAAQGPGGAGMAQGLLQHVGGERRVTDLRHIAELMHAEHPSARAHALALWLRLEQEDASRTEHLRRLESDVSAVQIYTIHSAKGLQFPFVYLPTAATEVLPNIDYPVFHLGGQRVIDVAGKPQGERKKQVEEETMAERSRLLYVALTRGIGQVTTYWAPAQHVHNTALHRLLARRGAQFDGKTPAADVRREMSAHWGEHVHVEQIKERPVLAVNAAAEPPTGRARTWTRAIDHAWRRSSYTSLAAGAESYGGARAGGWDFGEEFQGEFKESPEELAPSGPAPAPGHTTTDAAHLPSPMAELPRGAHFGSLVHGVLEEVDTTADDLVAEVSVRIDQQLRNWPQQMDSHVLAGAITAVLTTPLIPATPATLRDLDPAQQLAELDFELPLDGGERATGRARLTLRDLAPILRKYLPPGDPLHRYADTLDTPAFGSQHLRGYLTGSIDLVFAEGGRFYVADYKTNWLGGREGPNTTAAYDIRSLKAAMEGSSYPLQALLYTVALHRYLTWRLPGYDPEAHIGGVLYLYVRGMAGRNTPIVDGHSTGVFYWAPPPGLITELSALLDGDGGSDDAE